MKIQSSRKKQRQNQHRNTQRTDANQKSDRGQHHRGDRQNRQHREQARGQTAPKPRHPPMTLIQIQKLRVKKRAGNEPEKQGSFRESKQNIPRFPSESAKNPMNDSKYKACPRSCDNPGRNSLQAVDRTIQKPCPKNKRDGNQFGRNEEQHLVQIPLFLWLSAVFAAVKNREISRVTDPSYHSFRFYATIPR